MCFLTSSQWLDVEYGFRLQEWMLKNFEIIAIFESIDEPWFVGARVATTVTILRQQPDKQKRMDNLVRFVQLRRPIREILSHDGTSADAVSAVNDFRNEIMSLKSNTVNDRYRARLVSQGELWKQGVELGKLMAKASDDEDDEAEDERKNGKAPDEYYGGKWGIWLRAPDLWFELLDKYGDRLVPLGQISDIRRGITSGKDSFFFPKDCSAECLQSYESARDFQKQYGVPRKEVESGKVKLVQCGEERGFIKPIEAKYLEPEVHSLMEIDGFTVKAEDCARMILLVGKMKSQLRDKHVKAYIEWGEDQGFHEGSTCAARATETREWYDLTGHERGQLFWPMTQKYKHAIPVNDNNLICNHNLFDLYVSETERDLVAGILNSSLVILSKFQYGRYAGTEGTLKTEVIDVNMILVPDSGSGKNTAKTRISKAFKVMKERRALQILSERRLRRAAYTEAGKDDELLRLSDVSELDMTDRHELDDAVLELIGIQNATDRKMLRARLYENVSELFERNKQIEEKTNINKRIAARRGALRPEDVARELFDWIDENEYQLQRKYDPDFINLDKPFDTYDIPLEGEPEDGSDLLNPFAVRFKVGKKVVELVNTRHQGQSDLVILTAQAGIRSYTRFPLSESECRKLHTRYAKFVAERNQRLRALIEERVGDEEMQEKIFKELLPRILRARVKMSRP
jgi:hypothetical protein